MEKNIEINSNHIESIEVVKKIEHFSYKYIPEFKAKYFWQSSYDEFFVIDYDKNHSRESIDKMKNIYTEDNKIFIDPHVYVRMISGTTNIIYFKTIEDLNDKIDMLKVGIEDYMWKRI